MLNLIGTGLIAILIGFTIYYSWTHPKRDYEPRGAALGTIRAAQSVMIVGGVLTNIGIIGALVKLF